MHDTAYKYCELFYNAYVKDITSPTVIVELGSQDVNGSIRPIFSNNPLIQYTGIDYANGNGVDIVMSDPYKIPLPDNSADILVTSSCFEHIEMFWVMYLELMRVLRPEGLLYISAPCNNGEFHRHPVDCWRFNPDAGVALAKWGRYNGYNCTLIESFIGTKMNDVWHDFTSVFIKDKQFINLYPKRIVHTTGDYVNGIVIGNENITNYCQYLDKKHV